MGLLFFQWIYKYVKNIPVLISNMVTVDIYNPHKQ